MRFYGNDHTTINADILKIGKTKVIVKFKESEEPLHVFRQCIHNLEHGDVGKRKIEIDTWFLKRMRIIPIHK